MKFTIRVIEAAFAGAAVLLVVLAISAVTIHAWGWSASTVAAWVQAVGSIGAILGAIWIASEQHRRDVARQTEERGNMNYLVSAELAWVSGDVLGFLNEFLYIKPGLAPQHVLNNHDVADLLGRLSWCRQRISHKGQLAMLGTLRRSLIGTVRVVQVRERIQNLEYTRDEVQKLDEYREEARIVYNHAVGVTIHPQYSA